MRFASAAVALLLSACANQHIGAPAEPAPAPVLYEYTVLKDRAFTPKNWPQTLLADVYQPLREAPKTGLPAVVLIHGGAWARGDREQVEGLADRIARRGYVVMSVTYRFAPEYRFPAQVEDVQQAVLWLRQHARDYGVDAQRIAAWGYSAGAHLAGMLADLGPGDRLYRKGTKVQALVAGGSPMDLRKFTGGHLVPRFLGTTYQADPGRFALASPEVYVTRDDPPTFLYHGTSDDLVPPDQAEDYKKALDAAGITNELFWIGGRGHILAFYFDGEAVEAGLNFLDRHLHVTRRP